MVVPVYKKPGLTRVRSRVRLNIDLTRYHRDLVVGAEAWTYWETAMWGYWLYFDKAGRWDIIANPGTLTELRKEI